MRFKPETLLDMPTVTCYEPGVIAQSTRGGPIVMVLAKVGEKPSVVIEVITIVIFIGIVVGVLAEIAYAIGWIWRRVFGNEEQRTRGASAHPPTAFNCHLPRTTQSNQTYECPQGHIWVSYRSRYMRPGRTVYDPNSPGTPPQKRLIREGDTWVDGPLKWRYDEAASLKAIEAASLRASLSQQDVVTAEEYFRR